MPPSSRPRPEKSALCSSEIPSPSAGLCRDTPVELSFVEGKIVLQPLLQEPLTLHELLREVTDQNRHGEWDTGPAAGREIW